MSIGKASANERFKSRFQTSLAGGLIAAAVLHVAVFVMTPAWTVDDWGSVVEGPTDVIRLPDDIPIPAAPDRIRPAMPVVGTDVAPDATSVSGKLKIAARPRPRPAVKAPPPKPPEKKPAEKPKSLSGYKDSPY